MGESRNLSAVDMHIEKLKSTLEHVLDRHSTHAVLAPTHNPVLLARTPSIAADISHLLQVPESSWRSHPQNILLEENPPPAMEAYISRLRSISASSDPSRLLAHSYCRYLGDLSGGQHIRRAIVKAYDLGSSEERLGTQFYLFKRMGETTPCSPGDLNQIKEWFRAGMDEGVGNDESKKRQFEFLSYIGYQNSLLTLLSVAIADEACKAFQLNAALFSSLRPPSRSLRENIETPSIISPSDAKRPFSPTLQYLNAVRASFPRPFTLPWLVLTVVLTAISTHFLLTVRLI